MSPIPDAMRRQLRWRAYYHARSILWPLRFRDARPVLGRYACLGADVLARLGPVAPVVNIQKGRIDYVMDCWRDPARRARTRAAIRHVSRDAIVPCIMQEELLFDWRSPATPVALFMDSMAELADQRFTHRRDGWSFLCVYGDTTRNDALATEFEAGGLLPVEALEALYRRYFATIRARFGAVPIFFLHFPTTLETRHKYLDRAAVIRRCIDRLAAEFPGLHSIAIDESVVRFAEDAPPNMQDFPYHYNRETYDEFVRLIHETGDAAVLSHA